MAGPAPAFRRLRRGPVELRVAPAFEQQATALGLLEPDGVERLLARGEARGGRGRTARVALPDGSGELLLRPVLHGGLLGPVLGGALWGLRRPLAELEATAALRARGAPVPVPVLAAGRRTWGPVWCGALGTLYEEGTRDALRFLRSEPSPDAVLRAADACGRAVRRFHDAGGRHRDLHVGNLLLRPRDDGFEALVIDLDRVRLGEPDPARRLRELMRLHRSLHKRGLAERVGPRGRARFWSSYVGGDRELARAMRARLPVERLRLALHALRY